MTDLIEHKFSLSDNQKKKLGQSIKNKTDLTLRLASNNLVGDIPILLTKTQKNKVLKSLNLQHGVDLKLSKFQLQKLTKHGGFLPLLPLIMAGIGAIGSLAAGGAQIAKAVNQSKTNTNLLNETKRHNEMIENKLITGKGCDKKYKVCKTCNGKGRCASRRKGSGLFLGGRPLPIRVV